MLSLQIKLVKINELNGFDERNFSLNPRDYGFKAEDSRKAVSLVFQAQELAKKLDGICIAIIDEFALGEFCDSSQLLLFNAAIAKKEGADVCAFRGEKRFYIKYSPGEIL